MAKWHTDTMLAALLGDWWTEDMELHDNASMAQNVQCANEQLEQQGCSERVLECREHASGDELEWLCSFDIVAEV